MTKDQFLAGEQFSSNSLKDRKYKFIPDATKEKGHAGRLVEIYSRSFEYHCSVKSVNRSGFSIYKTIAGRIVRLRLRFDEFTII